MGVESDMENNHIEAVWTDPTKDQKPIEVDKPEHVEQQPSADKGRSWAYGKTYARSKCRFCGMEISTNSLGRHEDRCEKLNDDQRLQAAVAREYNRSEEYRTAQRENRLKREEEHRAAVAAKREERLATDRERKRVIREAKKMEQAAKPSSAPSPVTPETVNRVAFAVNGDATTGTRIVLTISMDFETLRNMISAPLISALCRITGTYPAIQVEKIEVK